MKRNFIAAMVAVSLLVYSCADKNKKEKNAEQQRVQDLVKNNRCLTCHSVDETINGPSYMDIAERYAGYPDTIVSHLANKVIHGGAGEWGEIYMAPNPKLSQPDAEAIVKYILSLKK